MNHVFIIVIALMFFMRPCYSDSFTYCTGNGAQPANASENKLLQQLIPAFAKEMGCEMDASHCATKWDIQDGFAKFSVAWKKQCGPVIDGMYQLGDHGRGSTFFCQKSAKNNQTCCAPLGYDYVAKWVACDNESKTSTGKKSR